ncbi:LysM peptidoglycan-binding domain-containing protein [Bacillus cihuensis]|uniref:LysM peptidoglycan-binding domain-containing protein n=1 Tax=Bacillus cihuensis TaxID=1208599 RepID=UPI000426910C|nr:LysM peptidoglycan-binding domain-containing protein [Bacillus cihuensis]
MSIENQSFLRFSLEESVWFQKGQEIEELYSLSLEPNVTIQESDQYVVIRGSLDLSGEYKETGEEDGTSDLEFSQPFYPKTIHSVDLRADGLSEFIHRIPVDITIPNNRIQSLDNIDVNIHAFDYFMPEKNCLKLEAELIISGIEDSRSERKQEEPADFLDEYEEEENERDEANSTWEETVEVEFEEETSSQSENVAFDQEPLAYYRDQEEMVNETEEVDDMLEENESEQVTLFRELEESANIVEEIDYSPEKIEQDPVSIYHEQEEIQTELVPLSREMEVEKEDEDELFTPFIVEARKLPDIEDAEESRPIYANKTKEIQEIQAVEPPKVEQHLEELRASEMVAEDVHEHSQIEKEHGPLLDFVRRKEEKSTKKDPSEREKVSERETSEKEATKEDHLSLTSFLGRKQEEELIGIKVCIVQQGETLDSLAERYEVSVQSLLNSNELEPSQDIYEGQVLYVPKVRAIKN